MLLRTNMFSHVVKVSNLNGYLAPVFVTLGTLFSLLVHKRISTEGFNKMLRNTIDIWSYLLAHLQALTTRRRP